MRETGRANRAIGVEGRGGAGRGGATCCLARLLCWVFTFGVHQATESHIHRRRATRPYPAAYTANIFFSAEVVGSIRRLAIFQVLVISSHEKTYMELYL